MKKLLILGATAALALTTLAVRPASAHEECDTSARYGYRSGYYGSRYYSGGYGDRYYDRGYGYYGGDRHDAAHDRLDRAHERAHDRGFESRRDHQRWHERAGKKHDVFHHRNYDEHAPNHNDWYYGDERDYYRVR